VEGIDPFKGTRASFPDFFGVVGLKTLSSMEEDKRKWSNKMDQHSEIVSRYQMEMIFDL